jgi:hypothetical protein
VSARCNSCGAEITWVVTRSGRPMPCDAKPVQVQVWTGQLIDTVHGQTHEVETKTAFVSHFVTCPNAAQHRRPR